MTPMTRRELLAATPIAGALGTSVLQRSTLRAAGGSPSLPDVAGGDGQVDAPPSFWTLVKGHFLVEDGLTYFNAGTCGLQTRETAETESRVRQEMALNFNRYFFQRLVEPGFRNLTERVAAFVGVDVNDFSFTSGATEAMNYIANGLDLSAGDEVITTTHDHQAGIYPWRLLAKRRGIRVKQITWPTPPPGPRQIVDLFARAITARTRVLSFCHVQYTDGTVLPVNALCDLARERKALSVVDGAQSVGMLDFAIPDLGCDAFATSLHKWLGAPYGTGLMWVTPALRDRVWPTVVESYDGWDPEDRYERVTGKPGLDFVERWPKAMIKFGTNVHYYGAEFFAVGPAVSFQQTIGRAAIDRRVRMLAARFRDGLSRTKGVEIITPEDPSSSAAMIAFRVPGKDVRLFSRTLNREDHFVIRNVVHEGIGFEALRACTHIYNTEDDVDRLVSALQKRMST